ncbi:hypothetical protein Unana1_05973 [Umbelopsis nana]
MHAKRKFDSLVQYLYFEGPQSIRSRDACAQAISGLGLVLPTAPLEAQTALQAFRQERKGTLTATQENLIRLDGLVEQTKQVIALMLQEIYAADQSEHRSIVFDLAWPTEGVEILAQLLSHNPIS